MTSNHIAPNLINVKELKDKFSFNGWENMTNVTCEELEYLHDRYCWSRVLDNGLCGVMPKVLIRDGDNMPLVILQMFLSDNLMHYKIHKMQDTWPHAFFETTDLAVDKLGNGNVWQFSTEKRFFSGSILVNKEKLFSNFMEGKLFSVIVDDCEYSLQKRQFSLAIAANGALHLTNTSPGLYRIVPKPMIVKHIKRRLLEKAGM